MTPDRIMALDCGTTGNRAMIFDRRQNLIASSYREFTQKYPKAGWVEHDAEEIWRSVQRVIREALKKSGTGTVAGLGITNQRETVVVWDRSTGRPLAPAIVWQCRRTSDLCLKLKQRGLEPAIHRQTGLFLDPYFSGSKIRWMVEHLPAVAKALKAGTALIGTIDSWVIWKLTGGDSFTTDPTNASRTLLYDIRKGRWDSKLLELFRAPAGALAEVLPCSAPRGITTLDAIGAAIPILGAAGDQQAAAFAQGVSPQGVIKNTYGTGLFLVAETGSKLRLNDRLITTVAASTGTTLRYALEGSVFIGGAAMQWLRDGLKIIGTAADSKVMAESLTSNDGVYFVPALAGLGCPHWDPNARGLIIGLTRQTRREHLVRAALESMAYQTRDVADLVHEAAGLPVKGLRVDGGAVKNDWLMQFQADILGVPVERPVVTETTALGAAALAGIAAGVWKNQADFLSYRRVDRVFKPRMNPADRNRLHSNWLRAVSRSKAWV
ncbi:MAG: glycerol kinase GlpK [Candidatus Omnitrophica bacterium]|nr:glycerol kinase GlpK [Candidatus Omnitrophota bacterium]